MSTGFSGRLHLCLYLQACKLAIRESIEKELATAKQQEGAAPDADQPMAEDPVPCITRQHFQESLRFARKSVSETDMRKYEMFAQTLVSPSWPSLSYYCRFNLAAWAQMFACPPEVLQTKVKELLLLKCSTKMLETFMMSSNVN